MTTPIKARRNARTITPSAAPVAVLLSPPAPAPAPGEVEQSAGEHSVEVMLSGQLQSSALKHEVTGQSHGVGFSVTGLVASVVVDGGART